MKTEKSILIAFIINLSFSIFEFIGGIFTGSIAIASDAIHDLGDAASIGIAYFLEKKSKRQPDEKYTYGYARYSLLGSTITSLVLLFGSIAVIYNAVIKMIHPVTINYDGMIIFAVIGLCVNFIAALVTHGGHSLNQRTVSLHMLEDLLGWAVVLVGAVIMRFTDLTIIDPIMSIGVALFIAINVVRNLKEIANTILLKSNVDVNEIAGHIGEIAGVIDVHHLHIWSIDGQNNYATMHVVSDIEPERIKKAIREELSEHGIVHSTIELELSGEECDAKHCHVEHSHECGHHHHHHHNHHNH